MAGQVGVMGMLAVASVRDIRKKQIEVTEIIIFSIIAVVIHMITGEQSIGNMLLGVIPGLILVGLSFLTKGKIGLGDGIIVSASGLFLGLQKNVELFLTGLVLCGIWALALIVIRKKKGSYEIPFVPFLLAAYMEMLIVGAINGQ